MNILPLAVEWKSAAVHTLMMLHCRQAHPFRQPGDIIKNMGTIHRMLNVLLVILAFKCCNVLFEQAPIKLRFSYIMQKPRKDNILRGLTVKFHPLGNDTREDRNTQ